MQDTPNKQPESAERKQEAAAADPNAAKKEDVRERQSDGAFTILQIAGEMKAQHTTLQEYLQANDNERSNKLYDKLVSAIASKFDPPLLPAQLQVNISKEGKDINIQVFDKDSDKRLTGIIIDTNGSPSGGGDFTTIDNISDNESRIFDNFQENHNLSLSDTSDFLVSKDHLFRRWDEKNPDGTFVISDDEVESVKSGVKTVLGYNGEILIKVSGSRAGNDIQIVDKKTGRTILRTLLRAGAKDVEDLQIKNRNGIHRMK